MSTLSGGTNIVTDGLVLYLDAANTKSYPGSGTTWTDLADRKTGRLTNGPTFSSANGGSIVFDGIDDYISLNLANVPNLTNPLTVCAFVNTSIITSSNQVIYGPEANGSDNWISISNNRAQILATELPDVNNFFLTSTTVIQSDTWYYITGIVNNNVIQLYINGVLEATSDTQVFTAASWNSPTRIGQRATGQFPFNGRIAHLQGYNRALSGQEILQNYNATKKRYL